MIPLHRLGSKDSFHLNVELIKSVQGTADTILHLVTGEEIRVTEPADVVAQMVFDFKVAIAARALRIAGEELPNG